MLRANVALVLLGMMVLCGIATAGVSGQFIDFPLTTLDPRAPITQTDDLITMTASSGLVAYNAAVGVPSTGNDVNMAAAITFANNTELGFCARFNDQTMDLYEVSFNPTNNFLALVKITGGTDFTNLDTEAISGFVAGGTYNLSFSAQGSSLVGEMWNGNTLMGSVVATDSSFASGASGVFAFKHTDLITGSWAQVPEPTTLVLLGAGAIGMYIKRKRG